MKVACPSWVAYINVKTMGKQSINLVVFFNMNISYKKKLTWCVPMFKWIDLETTNDMYFIIIVIFVYDTKICFKGCNLVIIHVVSKLDSSKL